VQLRHDEEEGMILIVAPEADAHAQAVRAHLRQMGAQVALLDLAEFPQQAQVAMNLGKSYEQWESTLSDYERDLNLSECRVVWWRQAQPFLLHPELTDQAYRSFAYVECQSTISGLWLSLDAFWVNHPVRNEAAARQVYQLKVAQQVGLTIPATLITNNPVRARASVQQHGIEHTVYRTFSAADNSWQAERLLAPQQRSLLDNVCYAPVVFQEYVPAQADLHIVVAGESIFAGIVPGTVDMPEDEPMSFSAGIAPYTLSPQLREQIRHLMAQLGLVYAVLHLRITPTGKLMFQTLNPTGSWLSLEERTDFPISEAVAQLLCWNDVPAVPKARCVRTLH